MYDKWTNVHVIIIIIIIIIIMIIIIIINNNNNIYLIIIKIIIVIIRKKNREAKGCQGFLISWIFLVTAANANYMTVQMYLMP